MLPPICPVGIDVSKGTLDVALIREDRTLLRKCGNTPREFPALLTWMRSHASAPLHVCLEPTGTYHDALLAFLQEQGITVSLVPPSRVKAFRCSEGVRQKTDRQDARLLAAFCQQKQPAAFVPAPQELLTLRLLLARLDQLGVMAQQERNHQENSRLPDAIRVQMRTHQEQLEGWRKELLSQIRVWVKEHEALAVAVSLLQSLKGIGELSAWYLVSVIGPDAQQFASARQLVAYVGLDVVHHESGTSVRRVGHISKQGSPRLRRLLGIDALVAKRWDADMRQWANQLTSRGKKSRQVRVAVMRKLLVLAYGLLKHQQTYDPACAWPTHACPHPQSAA